MSEKLRFYLTLVIGLLLILCLNLVVIYFFSKKDYQLTDFLGKWELKSTVECKSCVNLNEEIIIKNDENFFIKDKQFKISKRILIEDYTIPTDVYVCFSLDENRLQEVECKDTKETSTYNLIYERSS